MDWAKTGTDCDRHHASFCLPPVFPWPPSFRRAGPFPALMLESPRDRDNVGLRAFVLGLCDSHVQDLIDGDLLLLLTLYVHNRLTRRKARDEGKRPRTFTLSHGPGE